MAHFSIYCGISNISISDNDDVYFLPLTKYIAGTHIHSDYVKYYPLSLPILCKYDNYGKAKDIVEDDNTFLIEKYFKTSIDDFINSIIDNNIKYGDKHQIGKIENIQYVWILKSVYDELFETYKKDLYDELYDKDSDGNYIIDNYDDILRQMGYIKTGNMFQVNNVTSNEYINKDKEVVYSNAIYKNKPYFTDKQGNPCLELDEKFKNFTNNGVNSEKINEFITNKVFRINNKRNEIINDFMLIKDLISLVDKDEAQNILEKNIIDKYSFALLYSINKYSKLFIDDLYKLHTVTQSLHNMSNYLKPYNVNTITPQDNQHEEHLKILNIFTKALKNKLKKYE